MPSVGKRGVEKRSKEFPSLWIMVSSIYTPIYIHTIYIRLRRIVVRRQRTAAWKYGTKTNNMDIKREKGNDNTKLKKNMAYNL